MVYILTDTRAVLIMLLEKKNTMRNVRNLFPRGRAQTLEEVTVVCTCKTFYLEKKKE